MVRTSCRLSSAYNNLQTVTEPGFILHDAWTVSACTSDCSQGGNRPPWPSTLILFPGLIPSVLQVPMFPRMVHCTSLWLSWQSPCMHGDPLPFIRLKLQVCAHILALHRNTISTDSRTQVCYPIKYITASFSHETRRFQQHTTPAY